MIKVLMVDDHALIREGLKKTLSGEPDLTIVGEANNIVELFKVLEQVSADIILLDITMPGESGLDALHELHQKYPHVPVLILTNTQGAEQIARTGMPDRVRVRALGDSMLLTAHDIVEATADALPESRIFMMEGGPHITAFFFQEQCLDELFLTIAPQVAGRGGHLERLGLTSGVVFATTDAPPMGVPTNASYASTRTRPLNTPPERPPR